MAKIEWGRSADRTFEYGVDRGVLYVEDQPGVPWNGLKNVTINPVGGSSTPLYIDGKRYENYQPVEEFSANLAALYSPEEFDQCDGSLEIEPGFLAHHQERKQFGLSYRSTIGTQLEEVERYDIHFLYNLTAQPSARNHATLQNTIEPMDLSWDLESRFTTLPNNRNGAHLSIDTKTLDPLYLEILEDIIYGSSTSQPRLPTPEELYNIITGSEFMVIERPNGRFIVSGPDDAISKFPDGTFTVTWSTAVYVDADTYRISSD